MGKRVGRKRKLGVRRKPSGQIANLTVAETTEAEAETKSVVRLQRYRAQMESLRAAANPQGFMPKTPLALFQPYVRGQLDEHEYEAGNLYGALARRYAALKGIPLQPDCLVATVMDMQPAIFRELEMAYLGATDSLKAVSRSTVAEVAAVCIYGEPMETVYNLKRGLGSLVEYWQLKASLPGESEFSRKIKSWCRA